MMYSDNNLIAGNFIFKIEREINSYNQIIKLFEKSFFFIEHQIRNT